MIVADTTPLSVFLRIGRTDLLATLFAKIRVPQAVARELDQGRDVIGDWRATLPSVETCEVHHSDLLTWLRSELDEGEAEAIALTLQTPGEGLLIDEAKGRAVARRLRVSIIGSVGVVLLAKDAKDEGLLTAARPVIDDLRRRGGLWLGESFYQEILTIAGEA